MLLDNIIKMMDLEVEVEMLKFLECQEVELLFSNHPSEEILLTLFKKQEGITEKREIVMEVTMGKHKHVEVPIMFIEIQELTNKEHKQWLIVSIMSNYIHS